MSTSSGTVLILFVSLNLLNYCIAPWRIDFSFGILSFNSSYIWNKSPVTQQRITSKSRFSWETFHVSAFLEKREGLPCAVGVMIPVGQILLFVRHIPKAEIAVEAEPVKSQESVFNKLVNVEESLLIKSGESTRALTDDATFGPRCQLSLSLLRFWKTLSKS